MSSPTRIALALGSGGARGYAHIGALQVLEERGFEVVAVAGSSMGALVGGVYAAGKLAEYTEWALGLSQFDVVRLLDVSLSAPGAIRAEKVVAIVRDLLDGARIEDLPIPYTAVATDLVGRKEVWFQQGLLDVAIRASIAIPGVITPVMLNGRLLADGGVMNPVPIAPMAAVHADATLGILLSGAPRAQVTGSPVVETAEDRPVEEWSDRFRRSASKVLDRDVVRSLLGRFGVGDDDHHEEVSTEDVGDPGVERGHASEEHPFGHLPAGLGKFDMMSQSLDAMQSVLIRYRLASYPPDVLVSVPKDACRSLDFHRAAEMIELGRELTAEALDRAGLVAEHPASDHDGVVRAAASGPTVDPELAPVEGPVEDRPAPGEPAVPTDRD